MGAIILLFTLRISPAEFLMMVGLLPTKVSPTLGLPMSGLGDDCNDRMAMSEIGPNGRTINSHPLWFFW